MFDIKHDLVVFVSILMNLWNYALVEDIDNWTQSYIQIIIKHRQK